MIDLKRIAGLFASTAMGAVMVGWSGYYAHLEFHREPPNNVRLTGLAIIGVVGMLVIPSIYERLRGAVKKGGELYRYGRRAYDTAPPKDGGL